MQIGDLTKFVLPNGGYVSTNAGCDEGWQDEKEISRDIKKSNLTKHPKSAAQLAEGNPKSGTYSISTSTWSRDRRSLLVPHESQLTRSKA
uniref:Uncharacterized protein n=1 Tax=Ditylenchus dipsaci TaxID=166011 RepID=A0A915D2Q7_9BILA